MRLNKQEYRDGVRVCRKYGYEIEHQYSDKIEDVDCLSGMYSTNAISVRK